MVEFRLPSSQAKPKASAKSASGEEKAGTSVELVPGAAGSECVAAFADLRPRGPRLGLCGLRMLR